MAKIATQESMLLHKERTLEEAQRMVKEYVEYWAAKESAPDNKAAVIAHGYINAGDTLSMGLSELAKFVTDEERLTNPHLTEVLTKALYYYAEAALRTAKRLSAVANGTQSQVEPLEDLKEISQKAIKLISDYEFQPSTPGECRDVATLHLAAAEVASQEGWPEWRNTDRAARILPLLRDREQVKT